MKPLFTPYGWIFKPTNATGWIITLLAAAFCVHIIIVVDSYSHSVADTLYGIFPYVVPMFGLWYWVASHTSRN